MHILMVDSAIQFRNARHVETWLHTGHITVTYYSTRGTVFLQVASNVTIIIQKNVIFCCLMLSSLDISLANQVDDRKTAGLKKIYLQPLNSVLILIPGQWVADSQCMGPLL